MGATLYAITKPLRFLAWMPFHVAANRGGLSAVNRLPFQDGVERLTQVCSIQGLVVAWAAAIELAAVAQCLLVIGSRCKQVKLWCASRAECFGQGLLLIHQVIKAPLMAFGLLGQLLLAILWMGDQAIATDRHHLNPCAVVLIQAAQLWLNVLHEWAMRANHHQQHRALIQFGAADLASLDLWQAKVR